MFKHFDSTYEHSVGGTQIHTLRPTTVEEWDTWWKFLCFQSRSVSRLAKDAPEFLQAINVLLQQGKVGDNLKFLLEQDPWDAENWIRRAYHQYGKLHEQDPEKFPECGFEECFKRIRAYRKEEAARKKAEKEAKKCSTQLPV